MEKIIPRWEWRTFGKNFGVSEEKIKGNKLDNFKHSTEKYILSKNSNENCKIRDDLMDIKSLQTVNENKLEQWYPTLKETFPMSKETIQKLFRDFFKVQLPVFKRDSYSYEQYLEELVGPCKDLVIVDVIKDRSIYKINQAIVEIAEASFNGVPMRTICVEHEDPVNVINTVRELGLEHFDNINYLRAMKMAVGMEK